MLRGEEAEHSIIVPIGRGNKAKPREEGLKESLD